MALESAIKVIFCSPGHPHAALLSRAQPGCHTPQVATTLTMCTELKGHGPVYLTAKHTAS